MQSNKEEIIQQYIAQASHTRHCAMRIGDGIDMCDCGLKYLRESIIETREDSTKETVISDVTIGE